jgi:hypothetical protein
VKQVRQLLKLTAAERSIVLRAVPLLAAVRLCLWIFPFPTLHRVWSSVLPRVLTRGKRGKLPPERIVGLVAAASRCIPGAHCLTRAVAAQLLLARAGHLAEMRIGVRKDRDNLDAHAWLECDGVPLFESDAHLKGFTPFAPAITSPRDIPTALK